MNLGHNFDHDSFFGLNKCARIWYNVNHPQNSTPKKPSFEKMALKNARRKEEKKVEQ